MTTIAPLEYGPWADHLGIGVTAVDASGRQVYANARFAEMLGWPASELIGATPPFLYWPAAEQERACGIPPRPTGAAAETDQIHGLCVRACSPLRLTLHSRQGAVQRH